MKGLKGTATKIIMSSVVALSVLGNGFADMMVRADEGSAGYSQNGVTESSSESGTADAAATAFSSGADEAILDDSNDNEDITDDAATTGSGSTSENTTDVNSSEDVSKELHNATFYILNAIDSDLPDEPESHPSSNYSNGIYILNCTSKPDLYSDYVLSTDNDESALSYGEYTLSNEVLEELESYPSIEQIQYVFPDFDPYTEYIQWYVIKYSGSAVHVDGVVRTRQFSSYEQTENTDEQETDSTEESSQEASDSASKEISDDATKESSQEASDSASKETSVETTEEPDVVISISTICNNTEFECDGQEHLIGDGFVIRVSVKDDPETFIERIYDKFGELVTIKSSAAAPGEGTYFSYRDTDYWVNIDAAYTKVVANTLSNFNVPINFIFNNQIISSSDITVKVLDENGNYTNKEEILVKVDATESTVEATPVRSITLEAGSIVQNDNGETITSDKYEIVSGSLLSGHKIANIVFNGSQTGAGESSNEITSCTIVDENGNDVTSGYKITYKKGKLILVDAGDDVTDSASTSSSSVVTAASDSESVANSSSNVNSTGNYTTLSSSANLGISVVTNSQIVNGQGPDDTVIQDVLGVRKSATGDMTQDLCFRLLIILICVFLIIQYIINYINANRE